VTARLKVGKAAASPTPRKKRIKASAPTIPNGPAKNDVAATAVQAVKQDHQISAIVRTMRTPQRSLSHPPGIWKRAYPTTNAEKIQPISWSVSPSAGII
jgi:hypothetical protein